ncbi:MAG: SUMF1/EgtB/PvdO family nonheme iron enzyme [Blastocatellia bacterium]|nr:SUMF1/EgtB/PvdO family nonheme iron enzyme [Blastocatellia bacterium]
MLASGTLLQHRYRIVRPLSKGGMGAVYEARDERLSYTVALKETFFTEPEMVRAFEREARILARLRHPSLPKVSDHFLEESGQFLVMEFITGKDLLELLDEFGAALPLEDVLLITDRLLDALDYLHTQQPPIIHRDIKPANIKLTERGEVILLDFGLAKGLALTQEAQVSLNASIRAWTPGYAPIEQFLAQGTDAQSDLFSLGATLYHLITGKPPLDVVTRSKQIYDTGVDPLRLADEVNRAIPFEIGQILAGMMAIDRLERPASAREVREQFQQAAQALPEPSRRNLTPVITTLVLQAGLPKGNAQFHRMTTEEDIDISNAETALPSPHLITHNATTVKSGPGIEEAETIPYPAAQRKETVSHAATIPIGARPQPVAVQPSAPPPATGRFLGFAVLALAGLVAGSLALYQWSNRTAPVDKGTAEPVATVLTTTQNTMVNDLGMEFIQIPSGRFTMGFAEVEAESPLHVVMVRKPFYLARYETTQAQWKKVMGTNPSFAKGDMLPVEGISWDEVQLFLKKLNAMQKEYSYRLPSEAEWEYACRGQTTGFSAKEIDDMAWHEKNARQQPHPVGGKRPNPFGLYDMLGNVAEWCQDSYHKTYVNAPADETAWETNPDQPYRMIRGGSWHGLSNFCRPSFRDWMTPDSRAIYVGVRLVAVKNDGTSKETSGTVERAKKQPGGPVR